MGTYVFGAIGTALGGPIGGIIGAAIGGLADRLLINAITPGTKTTTTGPRLTELSVTTSTEGAVIPKVYGRCRFGGQVIWTAQFKETEKVETEEVGGKGGPTAETTTTTYTYSLSFAVAFCEGNRMAHLGRVWIDSNEADLSKYNFRFYPGSETQTADPTMEAVEGVGLVPAYRGLAYIVFEDMPLADFGNRLPQLTAEIIVPLETEDPDDLSNLGRSWQLIPATGENIYGTRKYTRLIVQDGERHKVPENMHNNFNRADAEVALDILSSVQPNLDAVSVVVSWFGTDLRAGECRVVPKVEVGPPDDPGGLGLVMPVSEPEDWAVAGYDRETAEVVSYKDGSPIFGGTPSDVTVRELVQHLKDMGRRVMFYPFVLMDVPEDNELPDPYSDGAAVVGQPAFPWRGRITCSPAAGYAGTVDKTADAKTQVDTWFTRTEGYRAMVLHYADLLSDLLEADDAFIVGSELVGLTTVRASPATSVSWRFAGSADGWTSIGYTQTATSTGLTLTTTAGDPNFVSPTGLSLSGMQNRYVLVDLERVSAGSFWDGTLFYGTAGHDFSAGYYARLLTANPAVGERRMLVFDMWNLTVGGNDWQTGTITKIRLDFDQTGSSVFKVHGVYLQGDSGQYPAVAQLVALAADVSAVLDASVKVSYAADWSEYHSHRPADGSNDVIFNMDPLWSSADVDFVGIDNYLPVSDWRDGTDHLDYDAVQGPVTIYDREYLKSNIEGGEYFDWYYRSQGDRDSQTRTPITDGDPANEPWIYRQKDMRNWWGHTHHSRPGGVRSTSATAWTAGMKPIWFTEFGAPAVDKATNQPNVFYDPKSSESLFPYYSRETRDDAIQRLYLECTLQYWRDHGGSMVSIQNCFIWTWDARPFPAYPMRTDVWADGLQWQLGHWLSGRIDGVMLPRLAKELCLQSGLSEDQIDVDGLYGPECIVRGLLVNNQTSARDILETLAQAYEFKGFESAGSVKFVMDINQRTTELPLDDLVLLDKATAPVKITRGQETELPRLVNVSFLDELNAYQTASVDGHKGTGTSQNQTSLSFPLVWTDEHARAMATSTLFKAWAARERGNLALPPSYARMDVGDVVYVPVGSRAVSAQLTDVTDAGHRAVEFMGFDQALLTSPGYESDIRLPNNVAMTARAILIFMNLPLLTEDEPQQHSMRLAAGAPDGSWPGGVRLLRSDGGSGFLSVQTLSDRSSMGVLSSALYPGPTQVWDRHGQVEITMLSGGLTSLTEESLLLGGLNALALQNSSTGEWEVMQFASADLTGPGAYRLSDLIRGQLGTEHVMRNPYPVGTRVVLLSTATVRALMVTKSVAMALTNYRWGPSNRPTNDDLYVNGNRQGTLAGLRPYSPCDLVVVRNSADDSLQLTWKRRARLGGDNWEAIEVPLSEEAEQYKLEIYNDAGTVLKRTEVLTSPSYVYTAANQVTDQGSVQTDVFVRVYQFGADYGNYGPPLEGMFYMKGSI